MALSYRSSMPTAARLVGAVVFAIWGFYLARLATPFFLQGQPPAIFLPACVIIGVCLGWVYVGRRLGNGYGAALGIGLTAGFVFGFLALLVVAFALMIRHAMHNRYQALSDAVLGIFDLMIAEASRFTDPTLITSLFAGAVLCAWVAEWVAQRSR
jgi:hypothetical protein